MLTSDIGGTAGAYELDNAAFATLYSSTATLETANGALTIKPTTLSRSRSPRATKRRPSRSTSTPPTRSSGSSTARGLRLWRPAYDGGHHDDTTGVISYLV
ncbi:MAG: hypothetical protein R3C16_08605 [Hyphomonadaceae bacterium]